MKKEFICCCGLYCEHCAVKAKITPAANTLYQEMVQAGFADVIDYIPGGSGFWPFLESMASGGLCASCKEGGGDPGCAIRICAREKGMEMCALCTEYPCLKFETFFQGYVECKQDNEILRTQGMEAWIVLQDDRLKRGYVYVNEKA